MNAVSYAFIYHLLRSRDEMIVFRVMIHWKRKTNVMQNAKRYDTCVFWRQWDTDGG